MSIKDRYYVQSIPKKETYSWLLRRHYAHRLPMSIEYSFGLYNSKNKIIQGVCVFGPTAPPVPITVFGKNKDKYKVRELTRLIINEGMERNVLSYFVSKCLKYLREKEGVMCIVSFSDLRYNHYGYIYQALKGCQRN